MNLILISSITTILIPPLLFIIAWLLSAKPIMSNREKLSPFECGFDPTRSARTPFSMRFFLLAVIFIVFDIEIVLLIPIPMLLNKMNTDFLLMSTLMFMVILIIGLLYEWYDGSLNWKN